MINIFSPINSKPRIKPLLWNLISFPLENFKLQIFNNIPENNELITKDLKLFGSMIKWDLLNYNENGLTPKINLYLPANSIPYKDSIKKLIIKDITSYPKCFRPSALFAYLSNQYSNYFNKEILAGKDIDKPLIYYSQNGDLQQYIQIEDSIFIIPEEEPITNFTYKLIETNEINPTVLEKSK